VSWPKRLEARGVRSQFHHVMDIVPTILEVVGVEAPESVKGVPQMPIHGTSMAYSFSDVSAPTRKRSQVFEMFGHRAIWHDGWKAVCFHTRYGDYDDDTWELYHTDVDFAENRDVADEEPQRLAKMIELWWAEAGRYDILPLDDRGFAERRAMARPREDSPRIQTEFRFYPGMTYIPGGAAPFIMDRSYEIEAQVRASEGDEGVIAACGGLCGGYTLYVKDGVVTHDYNFYQKMYRASARLPARAGWMTVRYAFEKTGPCQGTGRLYIDGNQVSEVRLPRTYKYFMDWEGFALGRDAGSPVSPAYADRGEFPFSGQIRHVAIRLGTDLAGPNDYETGD
jgi:arylsulfatase